MSCGGADPRVEPAGLMAETDQERLVRILATSLTDRIEWALSLEARLAALEAGGGGGGGGLPAGGDVGDVVTNTAPGEGDWERLRFDTTGLSAVTARTFSFDDPGLANGISVYSPNAGDVLLALWVEIDTAWDGTTPLGDVGQFVGPSGIFHSLLNGDGGACLDMTSADISVPLIGGDLLIATQGSDVASTLAVTRIPAQVGTDGGTGLLLLSGAATSGARILPGKFTSNTPIQVVVSTDGTTGGDDPAATQGSATLYVVTATPLT